MATDELGSRISVRGGSPDENLTIMDGVEIHNPYRLFGLTSAFNPETVARFDFSPGGSGSATAIACRRSWSWRTVTATGGSAVRILRAQHHRRERHLRRQVP